MEYGRPVVEALQDERDPVVIFDALFDGLLHVVVVHARLVERRPVAGSKPVVVTMRIIERVLLLVCLFPFLVIFLFFGPLQNPVLIFTDGNQLVVFPVPRVAHHGLGQIKFVLGRKDEAIEIQIAAQAIQAISVSDIEERQLVELPKLDVDERFGERAGIALLVVSPHLEGDHGARMGEDPLEILFARKPLVEFSDVAEFHAAVPVLEQTFFIHE